MTTKISELTNLGAQPDDAAEVHVSQGGVSFAVTYLNLKQTAAQIKTAYESNSNTNAFTDAEQSKLTSVSSGAEVNPDVVPQAEAEAGVATTERTWTAERVSQAITALGAFSDHGGLTGLEDDDHTQYHTDARAVTWLGTRDTDDLPEGATNLYVTALQEERIDNPLADLATVTHSTPGNLTRTYGQGQHHTVTLEANADLQVPSTTGVPATSNIVVYMTIKFVQDATGGRAVTFAGGFNILGITPGVDLTADAETLIRLWSEDNGTTWNIIGDIDLTNFVKATAVPALASLVMFANSAVNDRLDAVEMWMLMAGFKKSQTVTSGSETTPDLESETIINIDLDAVTAGNHNIAAPTNVPSGVKSSLEFYLTADGTDEFTWDAAFDWGSQTTEPDISAGSNGDIFIVIAVNPDGGATWHARDVT